MRMLRLVLLNIFNYQVVKVYHSKVVQSFKQQPVRVEMFRTSCQYISPGYKTRKILVLA